jgi:hypothetical protein
MGIELDSETDNNPIEKNEFDFKCFYCGRGTHQSPVIFDVRQFDEYKATKDDYIIYPSCCGKCCMNEIWRSIRLDDCDKSILGLSFHADEQSIKCAKMQEAYDRICISMNITRGTSN